jgi:hypothetical protein
LKWTGSDEIQVEVDYFPLTEIKWFKRRTLQDFICQTASVGGCLVFGRKV